MRILVTGATGGVGRLVVDHLVDVGAQVRAMTRNPATAGLPDQVEVVAGDLHQPDTLDAALAGVDRMYLFPVPATAPDVVARARKAGVGHVVVLSSGAVTVGLDTDHHLVVEQAVESSGLSWTHVRPGEFALNKLWLWGPSIRDGGVVRHPAPDSPSCCVHERDIADVATTALLEDRHTGQALTLNGPEFLTLRQQVAAIAEAVGREIRMDQVTPEEAREEYLRQGGFAAANADFLLGFADYSGAEQDPQETFDVDVSAYGPLPTAQQVTGRPARTFAEWARDHADDFR